MDTFVYSILFFGSSIVWLFLLWIIGGRVAGGVIYRVFPAGMIAGPAAGALTLLLQNSLRLDFLSREIGGFFLYFFLIGPIEEVAKFLAMFLGAHRDADFKNASDGIMIAAAAALGFAAGENLLYLYAFGPENTIYRLILANAGHAAFSVPWGYGLGAIIHERAPFHLLGSALLISALLHGAYDFLLVIGGVGPVVALLLLLLYATGAFMFIRIERNRNRKN
jgi:RsiW-degrading membrane proteinase PrsW (M82 family)